MKAALRNREKPLDSLRDLSPITTRNHVLSIERAWKQFLLPEVLEKNVALD